ncbi:hypothetical protein LJC34_04755 [Oscillospiraceae bacterium OttesenSCG-928-G22]|nr:hypothetical protein [Oscillospiraceae bacterium OttesenSCG-928-G22]
MMPKRASAVVLALLLLASLAACGTAQTETPAPSPVKLPSPPPATIAPVSTSAPYVDVFEGDTKQSSGTGGTVPLPVPLDVSSLKLSDVFFDGFNYIEYINEYLAASFPAQSDNPNGGEGWAKRPFTGIPNDYPHYSFDRYLRYISIQFLPDNPFFGFSGYMWDKEYWSISVPLTDEVSPYGEPRQPWNGGTWAGEPAFDINLRPKMSESWIRYLVPVLTDPDGQIDTGPTNDALERWMDAIVKTEKVQFAVPRCVSVRPLVCSFGKYVTCVLYAYDGQQSFVSFDEASYTSLPLASFRYDRETGKAVDGDVFLQFILGYTEENKISLAKNMYIFQIDPDGERVYLEVPPEFSSDAVTSDVCLVNQYAVSYTVIENGIWYSVYLFLK